MTDSLFDLVRAFDRILGSNDNQSETPTEFVSNIFSSILTQTRRPVLQVSKPKKVRFEEKEQESKSENKDPQPSVRSKLPRKPKQPKQPRQPKQPKAKKQSKEETDAIYAQHLKKWQDLRHLEQPPPYATCRNQPRTVDPSQ